MHRKCLQAKRGDDIVLSIIYLQLLITLHQPHGMNTNSSVKRDFHVELIYSRDEFTINSSSVILIDLLVWLLVMG